MNCQIGNLKDGDRIYGEYLITDVKKGVTANGRPYATISIQDCSGAIEGKKWDFDGKDEQVFIKGSIVLLTADVISYNNSLQLKIYGGDLIPQENIEWSKFVPNAPYSFEEMKKKLTLYIDAIKDDDIRGLVKAVIAKYKDKFLSHPAAVRNHHNYVAGLMYHSLTMADMAIEVCRVYPSLNKDIVLAGTIIHDIGKIVELSGPNATSFTTEGKLEGHISLGHAMLHAIASELGYFAEDNLTGTESEEEKKKLAKKKEIALVLEHIMLSHHGKTDFGSPVMPVIREALVVSMIDDMDAKMNILDKAYKDVPHGETTAKLLNMDDRYFYKPNYVDDNARCAGLALEEAEADLQK